MSREKGITRHALGSCFMHVVIPKPLHTFGRHALCLVPVRWWLGGSDVHFLLKVRKSEQFLLVSYGTCVVFFLFGVSLFHKLTGYSGLTFVLAWLFAAILGSALRVVRHAERLAALLGEPYGTLILTLSV